MRTRFLRRIRTSMILFTLRFLLYVLANGPESTNRRKKQGIETIKTMEFLEESLTKNNQLNEDMTEGPQPVQTKAVRKVIDAFVSQREHRDENDFYIYVAQAWVEKLERKSMQMSIKWAIWLVVLYIGTRVMASVVGSIEGIAAVGLFLIVMVSSIIGLLHALLEQGWQGWKRVIMLGVHAMIFIPFIHFLLPG